MINADTAYLKSKENLEYILGGHREIAKEMLPKIEEEILEAASKGEFSIKVTLGSKEGAGMLSDALEEVLKELGYDSSGHLEYSGGYDLVFVRYVNWSREEEK